MPQHPNKHPQPNDLPIAGSTPIHQQSAHHNRLLDAFPGMVLWSTIALCLVGAVVAPRLLLTVAACFGVYLAGRFCFATVANWVGLRRIQRWERTDWYLAYCADQDHSSLPWNAVQHVVIIPNYDEPLGVLCRTLEGLQAQDEASRRLHIVLAMEAREAGATAKARHLAAKYAGAFASIHYTLHPADLPGEMPCKSANAGWAARWAKRHLVDRLGYDMAHLCVTTMDADTRWHPHFFAALTYWFAIDPQRDTRFWQAPMRYHGNIWSVHPLLRIVNAYTTALELSYLAVPWWRALPISSYSLSLTLLHDSGYWDGAVIADEWHMLIKAYFASGGRARVRPVLLPFLVDVPVGNGLLAELRERHAQALRHAWGSKELGYLLACWLRQPGVPFGPTLQMLLRMGHDVLLSSIGWVIVTLGLQLPLLLHVELSPLRFDALLVDPLAEVAAAVVRVQHDPLWWVVGLTAAVLVLLGLCLWWQDAQLRPARSQHPSQFEHLLTALSFFLLPVLTLVFLVLPTIQAQTRLILGIPLQFRVSRKR